MTTKVRDNLVYGFDEYVSAWVEERMGDCVSRDYKRGKAIGVMSADRKSLIAGVTYFDYEPMHGTMQLAFASDNPMWARRETIKQLLAYPFDQLGIFKCWVTISSDNKHSIKTVEHIGFKLDGILSEHFGKKQHAVIMRMFAKEYHRIYGNI